MAILGPTPKEIAGYTVFPLALPPLPSFPEAAIHYLYLRPHEPKVPDASASRSLFLANIPFDSTELHLKGLFSIQIGLPQGRIEDIRFEGHRRKPKDTAHQKSSISSHGQKGSKRKRGSKVGNIEEIDGATLPPTWDRDLRPDGSTAVIVFVDRESMETALRAVKRKRNERNPPIWGKGVEGNIPALGSFRMPLILQLPIFYLLRQGYLAHQKLTCPDEGILLNSVNTYMAEFTAREAAQERSNARQRQVPDEDGFVTVTRGGRTDPPRQEAVQELAAKQKAKQKGFENFYRFQTREKRKAQARELMEKFEADQEKVKRMREHRAGFKASLS
ncbi:MAG: hypothetical protein LQ342_000412 [Letrouitia transgressa]|nr:MAG: hypothetical protein LQ342_000412 [Letrouitia transgressa]